MSSSFRARLVALFAWGGGALLVGWLIARIGWTSVVASLERGAGTSFVGYLLLLVALPLPLDSWATGRALARQGVRLPAGELLLARGASYLVGLINYALGQGSMAVLLARRGQSPARAAGSMLFVLATTGLATALLALLGTQVGPAALRSGPLTLLPFALAAVVAGYLPALAAARRIGWLARHPAFGPLLAAQARDHAIATACRLPHLAAMSVLGWGAFRVWGLPLPAAVGVPALPVVLLLASLPLTPTGLGTVQAAQVALFAPHLPGLAAPARESEILACALAGHALGLIFQALLGLACLTLLRRRESAASEAAAGPTARGAASPTAAAKRSAICRQS